MNKQKTSVINGAVLAALVLLPSFAFAATQGKEVTVTGVLTDDTNYGGCMARVDPAPNTYGSVTCQGAYITFSCACTHTTKSDSQTKYSAAQLAFVTGGRLFVILDDSKKHNGFCYAQRVDNLPPLP